MDNLNQDTSAAQPSGESRQSVDRSANARRLCSADAPAAQDAPAKPLINRFLEMAFLDTFPDAEEETDAA